MSLFETLFETFIWGVFGTTFIVGIGAAIFTLFKYPLIFLGLVGFFTFVLFVGWCILHYNNFCELFSRRADKNAPVPSYGNTTLGKLSRLENKYRITTVEFMSFASRDLMPYGMDNLDYLEWVSLVNELPSIIQWEA